MVFLTQTAEPSGGQRVLLAPGFLDFGDEGVRIEGDRVLELGIRVGDPVLNS
jgi:hypothetical protein